MERLNYSEMPSIHGRNRRDSKAFGRNYNRRVNRTQWQIAVVVDKLCYAKPVACRHWLYSKLARSEIA